MRLRLAPVEYKNCTMVGCDSKYEGAQCPSCKQAFSPEHIARGLHDRLILVDVDPPIYEQALRCRCTECKNLFAIEERDLVTRAQCATCAKPLFARQQLLKLWKEAETLLQRARKLDRALRQLPACPHCSQPVRTASWCPLHQSAEEAGPTGGLPQNPTVVWVRTFQVAESFEELQQQEWLEGNTELETENEAESETELETEIGSQGYDD